jgi:hypothetical protein
MSRLARAFSALFALIAVSGIACYSSDSLFIHLTATPPPTAPPPTQDVVSAFHTGDNVVIVSQGLAAVYLTQRPEPQTRRNRVPNAACYPNTTVQILNVQQVDTVTYYQIACNNTSGWLPESNIGQP